MTKPSTERFVELQPIRESAADFEPLEEMIRAAFVRLLYKPILKELGIKNFRRKVLNARRVTNANKDALIKAITEGRVWVEAGAYKQRLPSLVFRFNGKGFDAEVSAYLKSLGAQWRKSAATADGNWVLHERNAPEGLIGAIQGANKEWVDKLRSADREIQKILPAEIAESIDATKLFDQRLFRTDKHVRRTLKNITVMPELDKKARAKIAAEWQTNLKLWIKDFTAEEITRLRADVHKAVTSGKRYDALVSAIKRSYDVADNKAKFLARQETSLLMTKFKESRYTEAGVTKYKWGCVAGSPNHPVRPSHKMLEGKIFSWNDPPITTPPGEAQRRNNPGQDYNCRCFAKPIVRF